MMKLRTLPLLLGATLPLLLTQCVVDERGNPTQLPSIAPGTPTQLPGEEVPSTAPVPARVKNDCLAALRKQIPDRNMRVIRAVRGETSFIVDVRVDGVEKPWRCYHDGTNVTGTTYMGEG
jgi:hypothetical protein